MNRFKSFVVFAEMRTGSNFLEANLNALPRLRCHGEAFNPYFIGKLNQTALFGLTMAERDADPAAFLARMRADTDGMPGFRYFHDHDPRVFGLVMNDPACAKIVLTRNPIESYVSWKIAQATGQWKLTNAKKLRSAKARFDGAEFERHLQTLQDFQVELQHALQVSGQTAFWIDYEDVQDIEVLNGLAAFLGIEGRLTELDPTLKKQNPEDINDKVENPEDMAASLARLDRFNLSRTPNFEPRRAAAVPSFVAGGGPCTCRCAAVWTRGSKGGCRALAHWPAISRRKRCASGNATGRTTAALSCCGIHSCGPGPPVSIRC